MDSIAWNKYPSKEELKNGTKITVGVTSLVAGDVIRIGISKELFIVNSNKDADKFRLIDEDGYSVTFDWSLCPPNFDLVFSGFGLKTTVETSQDRTCTSCNVHLEWAMMAERCPVCWKVYTG